MSFDFAEEQKRRTMQAEEAIGRYLPKEEGQQHLLREAMNYSVCAGGKRLRPVLIRLAFELFGGKGPYADPFMAAMEMIHTHSLIHDDLPAMDNDTYRRGRKTCHVVYGEAVAILAGDGLLNRAYETAAGAFEMVQKSTDDSVSALEQMRRVARALRILADKTGTDGMMGGQSVDVIMEGKPLTPEQIDFIYALKTGALIEGSLMIGAALAGASEEDICRMEQIGRDIGLAFQIRDDILDIVGDQASLGKNIGSDEKNHKTTYVTLNGIEQAERDVEELTARAVKLLEEIPGEKTFLRELLLRMAGRKY